MKKFYALAALLVGTLVLSEISQAQGVSINAYNSAPDHSAMLHIRVITCDIEKPDPGKLKTKIL